MTIEKAYNKTLSAMTEAELETLRKFHTIFFKNFTENGRLYYYGEIIKNYKIYIALQKIS